MAFRARSNLFLLKVSWPLLILASIAAVGWGLTAAAGRFLTLHWGLEAGYFPEGLKTTGILIAAAVVVRILREVAEDRLRDERDFYATPLQRWFR